MIFLFTKYLIDLLRSVKYLLDQFWFIMLDNQSITNSKLSSISIAQYNTSSRASSRWWVSIIPRSATVTPVNKKSIPTTHFTWSLRLKIKSARALSCLMHNINTSGKFVSCCRQWSFIYNTLFCRIIIACSLS